MEERYIMNKYYWLMIGILWHILIFFQSSLPGEASASQSGFILDYIYPIISNMGLGLSLEQTAFIIRKLAHFTEYFILGAIFYQVYKKYFKNKQLSLILITHGLLTAILDETLQSFIPNRSGELRDVAIDTLGVITAYALCTIGRIFYERKRQKTTISN
jgi:VanZ family protein